MKYVRGIAVEIGMLWGFCIVIAGCHIPTSESTAGVPQIENDERIHLDSEMTVSEILPDTYVVAHRFPWSANSLVMKVSKDTFLLVDTPYTPHGTEQVVNWVEAKYGDVRIEAINTGFHVDNLGGNAWLLAQTIPIYGTFTTASLLASQGEQTRLKLLEWLQGGDNSRFYQAHKGISFKPPDRLFDSGDGKVLAYGQETVEIFFPGPSHSSDNLVVYATERQLLFGGCMVKSKNADNPGFIGDAVMDQWPVAIETVQKRYPNAKIVVPGHGDPGDRSLLSHTLNLLQTWNETHPE